MEGTLVVVVVVDFSLALDLSEIDNRYTTAHLDHHLLVLSSCQKKKQLKNYVALKELR